MQALNKRIISTTLTLACVATAARAEVIHVPGDYPSLRAAIKAAADGDKIVLANGVWAGNANLGLTLNRKSLIIRSQHGPEHCIIDGDEGDGWLRMEGEATAGTLIEGLTFRHVANYTIWATDTALTVRNCVFSKCDGPNLWLRNVRGTVRTTAFFGASPSERDNPPSNVVYGVDSDLSIAECRFEANSVEGAAIFVAGEKLIIEDSAFLTNSAPHSSAAVWSRAAVLSISRCDFTNNDGADGTAIYAERVRSGDVSIENCRFVGNRTRGEPPGGGYVVRIDADTTRVSDCEFTANQGYGIGVRGDLEATRCTFTSNTGAGLVTENCERVALSHLAAHKNGRAGLLLSGRYFAMVTDSQFTANGSDSPFGSGVRTGANAVLERCLIEDNYAVDGGGIRGDVVLRDCIVRNNTASNIGGAVSGNEVRIINCLISGNRAGLYGGAVSSREFESSGNLFVGNTAGLAGGALHAPYGTLNCTNSVIYGNIAESGSGGGVFFQGGQGALSNNVLWANEAPHGAQISVDLGLLSGSFNNSQGGRRAIWARFGRQSILSWNRTNIDADPLFVNPDAGDYRPQAGSPCIDAADNRAVPEFVAADPDGNLRFHDDPNTPDTGRGRGAIVDIGAYEFDAPPACNGTERLRAKCVAIDGGFAIEAMIRDGRPGARLTLESDANPVEPEVVRLNARGRGRASFPVEDAQSVHIRAVECNLVTETKCR